MKTSAILAALAACSALLGVRAARAQVDEYEKTEKREAVQNTKVDGKALEGTKISLLGGLKAAEQSGKPLSAKFEMEEGKLQLSVYTIQGSTFSEVLVDHQSGEIAQTEVIGGGEDLKAAREQSLAMAAAKIDLRGAVRKALRANNGFKAISAAPMMKDGHPVAQISLGREEEVKLVSEKLD